MMPRMSTNCHNIPFLNFVSVVVPPALFVAKGLHVPGERIGIFFPSFTFVCTRGDVKQFLKTKVFRHFSGIVQYLFIDLFSIAHHTATRVQEMVNREKVFIAFPAILTHFQSVFLGIQLVQFLRKQIGEIENLSHRPIGKV
jgi:hypothetical protein